MGLPTPALQRRLSTILNHSWLHRFRFSSRKPWCCKGASFFEQSIRSLFVEALSKIGIEHSGGYSKFSVPTELEVTTQTAESRWVRSDRQKGVSLCHTFTLESSCLWEGRSLGQGPQNGNLQRSKELIFPELQACILAVGLFFIPCRGRQKFISSRHPLHFSRGATPKSVQAWMEMKDTTSFVQSPEVADRLGKEWEERSISFPKLIQCDMHIP